MDLRRLELHNYLPFRSARIELPSTGLVFIAGPNNAGKSALLSAFDVVAGVSGSRDWRLAGASEPARVDATFSLDEDERRKIIGPLHPHQSKWLDSEAFKTIQLGFAEHSDEMIATALFVSDAVGELRRIASQDDRANLVSLDFDEILKDDPRSVNWVGMRPNVGPRRGAKNAINTQPPIARLWKCWAEALYHFSGVRTGTARSRNIADVSPRLQPTGVNLAECLLYQFSQGAPAWDAIQLIVDEVLPGVGDLVAPVAGSSVESAFIDPVSNVRRNLKDLGAGVEQVLMTTYVGVTQPAGSTILVEEPETNLHAAAERELLKHLAAWAKTRQIVLSTHSTVFLDQAAATAESTWVVAREKGESTVRPADTDLEGVLRAVGVRLSDMLSAERLILVEGETDAEILQAWFPDLVLTRRTAVVPLGGGDRAYQIEMIESVLNAADKLGRKILFLRDGDNLGAANREKLDALDRVTLLAKREIENYLLDAGAIVSVLSRRDQLSHTPDESGVDELIERSADGLRSVVVLKRVADELQPVRLVDRASIQGLVKRGGGLEELCDVVAKSLRAPMAVLSEVKEIWERVEREISEGWASDRRDLAPGAEVLEAVWADHGGRYRKRRDGPAIAGAMRQPPEEIRTALETFLGGVE